MPASPEPPPVHAPSRGWNGLPFHFVTPPESLHIERLEPAESMLWVATAGCADHTWRQHSMLLRTTIHPGVAAFKLGGSTLRDYRTAGRYAGCYMLFPEAQVRGLMGEDAENALGGLRAGASYQLSNDPFLLQAMRTIAADVDGGCSLGSAFAEAISISIVSYLARLRSGPAVEPGPLRDSVRLERVKSFIEAHLSADLSLRNIAARVHLSPRQLARAFQAAMGCSVHQYILERRVARARSMLARQSATAVSMELGFSSPSHFAQTFRAFTGVSPSEYKRSMA